MLFFSANISVYQKHYIQEKRRLIVHEGYNIYAIKMGWAALLILLNDDYCS